MKYDLVALTQDKYAKTCRINKATAYSNSVKARRRYITGAWIIYVLTFIVSCVGIICLNAKADSVAEGDDFYPLTTVVTEIEGGIATLEDFNGNLWQINADDFEVGDICTVIMNGNGTPKVDDDSVIKANYNGYFEEWAKRY